MKLWKVTYTFDILILADNHDKAKELAHKKAREAFDNYSPSYCFDDCDEILYEHDIPEVWRDGVPYSESGDVTRTVAEALRQIIAERRPVDLPGQGKLFAEEAPP